MSKDIVVCKLARAVVMWMSADTNLQKEREVLISQCFSIGGLPLELQREQARTPHCNNCNA